MTATIRPRPHLVCPNCPGARQNALGWRNCPSCGEPYPRTVHGRPPPGYRPSKPHKLAARTPAHLDPKIAAALAVPLPANIDLSVHPAYDQGQTSSCTAHALMKCVEIVTAWRGSMRCLYAQAGAIEGDTADDGREPLDCMQAIAAQGVAPYAGPTPDGRVSDVTPENATQPVSPAEATAADTNRINLGSASIDPKSDNLSDLVVASLAVKAPIYLGTLVDYAFEELQGQTVAQPTPPTEPDAGGHALTLCGVRTMPDGSRQFRVENSWGESWDEAGECWATLAWVAACSELHPCVLQGAVVPAPPPAQPDHRSLLAMLVVDIEAALAAIKAKL